MTDLAMSTPITGAMLEGAGWSRMKVSNFSDLIGPVWQRGSEPHFAFIVDTKHDNSLGRSHGGMIMTFCDDGMGVTARLPHGGIPVFTIEFGCKFISGPKYSELVELKCEIVQATRSLIFMRGTCFVGARVIATCEGIWKAPGPGTRKPTPVNEPLHT
jgi:acyl-coenzyme A thioesterase PaaI-like protein